MPFRHSAGTGYGPQRASGRVSKDWCIEFEAETLPETRIPGCITGVLEAQKRYFAVVAEHGAPTLCFAIETVSGDLQATLGYSYEQLTAESGRAGFHTGVFTSRGYKRPTDLVQGL